LKTCFVIQRFDNATYDKRYRETFAPAIERGGAKPIRADEILGTRPIVEKIEEGLRSCNIAFAEVSEDNPNVFLELGIALALSVPTVIVCDKARRQRLPFDIAHRPISFYATEAQSDYEKIANDVEAAIAAALLETAPIQKDGNKVVASDADIDDVKGACLIALLDQGLRTPIGSLLWEVQKEVSSAGISGRMVALALTSLINDSLVVQLQQEDQDGGQYNTYVLSDSGKRFLLRSYSTLMQQERSRIAVGKPIQGGFPDLDEDVPF
jgi:hypothetical protein